MSAPAIMRLQLGATQALVTSPTGASHLDKGLPCQDACMVSQQFYRGQPYMVLAVADGHGSEKYSRSEIGSHLAMEAVHQAATDLMMALDEIRCEDEEKWLGKAHTNINHRFQRQLLSYWKKLVMDHAENNPEEGVEPTSEASMNRYGTTIVVAIVVEDWVILGVLGDSTIYTVLECDGEISVQERLTLSSTGVGLGTDSMVSSNAIYAWRTENIPIGFTKSQNNYTLKMLLLTSDGMPDSLTDPKKSVQSIYENTQAQGIDWLQSILPQQLAQWSKDGVGDDMGMVLLFPNFSQTAINTPSTPDQTKEATS
jgi:serine/threonine protein phosphatase PrpC